MKNIYKLSLWGVLLVLLASCSDSELRVHYPASMPVFNSASVAENAIVYGDSITLSVDVSDPETPLSTLEIEIVVGDEIIHKESVRTKGNSSSYTQKYSIPFVAHMPDGAEVEVHLSSINVEGTQKDTVLTSTIASRPSISKIYLVTSSKAIALQLVDADNYIYSADGLSLDNDISFRLATNVTRFNKIDWNNTENLVFGMLDSKLSLVNWTIETVNGSLELTVDGNEINLSDPTLIGFNKISLDLFNFTISGDGDKLTPATSMDVSTFTSVQMTSVNNLDESTKEEWKKATMYLGKGTEMTIANLSDVGNMMDPTFFEVTGINTVKFLGQTGIYTVYYLPRLSYVFVEQPEAVYPDAVWLCGVGMGPARTPEIKTSSWNWNSPLEYHFCRKVSEGVFEAVFYALHQVDTSLGDNAWKATFGVKFMHQKGWGDEVNSENYAKPANGYLYSPSPNDVGNFNATDAFKDLPGIYRFTINMNDKTTSFEKISD